MTEQEAMNFCKNDPEAAAKIILMVEKLEKRIKELENQLATDSTNSSKPPSTDNKLKKKKKSLDKNSDNKRGAQTGHKGHHLKFSSNPDSSFFTSASLWSPRSITFHSQRRYLLPKPLITFFLPDNISFHSAYLQINHALKDY